MLQSKPPVHESPGPEAYLPAHPVRSLWQAGDLFQLSGDLPDPQAQARAWAWMPPGLSALAPRGLERAVAVGRWVPAWR